MTKQHEPGTIERQEQQQEEYAHVSEDAQPTKIHLVGKRKMLFQFQVMPVNLTQYQIAIDAELNAE